MKPRGFEFEEIMSVDPQKSWFDMSYKNQFTANFGKLYPFYVEETMPGDRFKIKSNVFARLQPLLSPVLQHTDIFSYFFYVPNRIIWDNWKKFQSNGDGSVKMSEASSYVPPEHPYILAHELFGYQMSTASYVDEDNRSVSFGLKLDEETNLLWIGKFIGLVNPQELYATADEVTHMFEFSDFMGVPCNKLADDAEYCIGKVNLNSGNYYVSERYSLACPPIGSKLTQNSLGYYEVDNARDLGEIKEQDKINIIPFLAYRRIWNEYFRAQDYMDELPSKCDDGIFDIDQDERLDSNFHLLSKSFEHDYFTSILPDAQRGRDVTLALAGTAPLSNNKSQATKLWNTTGSWPSGSQTANLGGSKGSATGNQPLLAKSDVTGGTSGVATNIDITGHTSVDLTGVSAITINALRYANTLQKYEEALARSGSRYNEMLQSIYGVISSDASIQRPIFLGASRTPISISDVEQTAPQLSEDTTPLATLAGRGIANGQVSTDFYCEENGWIIGVCAIVPRTKYFQGISRHLHKTVALDYPVPLFAHLGEQEVFKDELFASGSDSDRATLGYLPRFSEFKYHSDEIHGELKSSLSFWTMARHVRPKNYSIGVVVDEEFLKAENMPYDAFSITDRLYDHFIIDYTNNVSLQRSLPEYSTPKL